MKLQDPKVLSDWLGQDIPHRLRAALSLSPLLEEMLLKALPDDPQAREAKAKFCLEMGAWEGTFVATRWLIEFVGVNGDAAGNPIESRRRMERRLPPNKKPRHGFDVDIMDMPGGDYIDLTTANAKQLGAVWKGCSQASAHATHGSNHPSIARDRLTDALRIVASSGVNVTVTHRFENHGRSGGVKRSGRRFGGSAGRTAETRRRARISSAARSDPSCGRICRR